MSYNFNPLAMSLRVFLEKAKEDDVLFALEVAQKEQRAEKPKSFKECCDYIMGEAYAYAKEHKNGNFGLAGCDDEQIISMIKHYYDEDDIKIQPIVGASASVAKTGAKTGAKTKKNESDPEVAVKVAVQTKSTEQPKSEKQPSKSDIKKGADCYDLFGDLFS